MEPCPCSVLPCSRVVTVLLFIYFSSLAPPWLVAAAVPGLLKSFLLFRS